jgi:hypothetical protein
MTSATCAKAIATTETVIYRAETNSIAARTKSTIKATTTGNRYTSTWFTSFAITAAIIYPLITAG